MHVARGEGGRAPILPQVRRYLPNLATYWPPEHSGLAHLAGAYATLPTLPNLVLSAAALPPACQPTKPSHQPPPLPPTAQLFPTTRTTTRLMIFWPRHI
ncbi:hypothetical protein CIB48_g1226 [Xylaria polymorpha]|nr:hypothetical protein CIB48_g1226 [Xylaria polymorpha]